MKQSFALKFLLPLFSLLFAITGFSQILITSNGTAFTQNFDGMGSTATAALPTGFKIGTDWSTGTTATTLAYGTTGTGAVTGTSSGGTINWANGITASSTDRALGFLNTGTFTSPKSIVLKITNNTGGAIGSLSISFDYEKYRTGSRAFDWTFFHGSTVTPATSATGGDQSYIADGANAVVNPPTTISKTFNLTGLNIANGADYYLRWTFTGVGGSTNGQGIGIDNFSITSSQLVSSNADLSGLSLSAGILTPAFAAATTSYTASVANAVASITVTPTSADGNATITVNGNAVTSGNPSGSIALSVGANVITTVVTAQDATTTKTYTVTVTRAAAGTPTISLTSSLPDFGNVCINTLTGPNSFTIDGSSLDGSDISLAALSGFTYSETAGGTYTSTLTFSYTAAGFTGKVIYVKFNPTAVQSYNGDIVLSGGAVTSFNVAAAGAGVNTTPTVTTGSSTAVTATSGTPSGTITVAGCGTLTAYGIEYSTSTGFPNGTGIQVAASNLSGGNFSVNLTNLVPNTRYYYKAYVTVNAVTTYGTQQAFTCTPLPVPMAAQPGLSYTEDFADISDWSNFFILGDGANHFNGLSSNTTAPATPGLIPGATILTASTLSFQTNATGTPPAITSGGVQRGTDQLSPLSPTQSIILLSTGSPDNSTSAAIDFYMDFTGVNAGTLSFDFATLNNSTGNRNGSLRVYASVDGTSFTELTGASVLSFTNNTPISGSRNNIALPAIFNGSATARLRFYYHNGSGNTGSGSRPKISIDNLNVTALPNVACTTPTAAPTNLTFGTITDASIQGNFTAASPAPDHYLVVRSTSNTLSGNPVDGTNYAVGDALGGGTVVSYSVDASFTASGLTSSTTYYFYIFSANGVCLGGPLYYTAAVLTGNATTLAPPPACTAPASQASNLVFGTTSINSIQASFTAATADEYLVLRSTSATLSNNPTDAQVYNAGDILGNAVVVQRNATTSFTATGLQPNTQYYFFIFSINSLACVNGPAYNIAAPLNGTQTTQSLPPCVTPTAQPTGLYLTASNTIITGSFTASANTDDYLIIRSTLATLSATPADNTDYNVGDNLGGGTVISNSLTTSIISNGLTPNTTYYFFVFATNKNCSGGTKYNTANPLTGSATTSNAIVNNYYFGTFHSHSNYSDGTNTPGAAYDFAQNAECMDYLGISEHNHNTVGTTVTNYHLGITAAQDYTSTHSNFIALYGMEWGVINNGGHVLIYGDGMNNLWGWQSGAGPWGPTNNYDEYVPQSTYLGSTGLFKKVNDNIGTNTFASLAHPDFSHFSNIANIAYSAEADDAIVGTAVESGPAFSTNTTYTNPSTMSFSLYYKTMLAKGYHLGPTVDHDNHENTFGRTTRARTAVVAPALTKTEIIKGMRDMHFYATEDCDSKVDFTINTKIMGTIMTGAFAPNISIILTDGVINTPPPTTTPIIRIMFGVPGSGVLPVKIDSALGTSLNYTDNNLANLATGYYYLDITTANGGSIITAPIWYTRNDASVVLAVKLNSFNVQKIDKVAKITWTTEQETNSSHFVIERSVDGRTWNAIASVAAAGNSGQRINYSIFDNAPIRGINYYRLKEVDKDNKYEYSDIKKALFNTDYTVQVVPNPATDFINLYRAKTGNQPATIHVLNADGKIVYKASTTQSQLQISIAGMSKGLYFVKVIDATTVSTIRVVVVRIKNILLKAPAKTGAFCFRLSYCTITTCSSLINAAFLNRRIIFPVVTTSFWQYVAMRCKFFSFQ
jgi:hypothetical protein